MDTTPAPDDATPRVVVDPIAIGPLREARAAFEKLYIAEALRQHGGNVSRTARLLGVSRFMLQKKVKDYALR
ncbi:MAG: helix-turn-helix domain-containing protein [Thermodesulfobacteriota bacterium]